MIRFRTFVGALIGVGAVVIACGGANPNNGGPCAGCPSNKKCDLTLGCVSCTADNQCGTTAPFCVDGDCVACKSNWDCGAGKVCEPRDHTCGVPCTTNANCQPSAPICNTMNGGQCVGCITKTDCPAGQPLCDDVTKQCVACLGNGDCAATAPKCFRGSCVQCLSSSDCPSATPICDPEDLRCRTGCKGNGDCPPTAPLCDVDGTCRMK